MNRLRICLAGALALAAAIAWLPAFYVNLMAYVGMYSLVVVGLVLLTGIAGVTSFGQAAFVGIGAYATAVLTTSLGVSPWLTLAAGLALTGVAALLLGAITFRLSGHYLALGTLCWGLALYFIMGNVERFGGHTGISSVPKLPLDWLYADSARLYVALVWVLALAAILSAQRLLDSRKGRALRALKTSAQMAESFGVNTYLLRIQLFLFAALLASLSGWLYAHYIGFVNPTPFGIYQSIEYLFMAVLGGSTYLWGAVLGAGTITLLRELLKDVLPGLLGRSGNFEVVVLGLILMLVMQRARTGIAPWVARVLPAGWRMGRRWPGLVAAADPAVPATPEAGVADGPLLSLHRARRTFGGLVAVNDVSFELARGGIMGLIGPNGAGKSTTFNLITNVLPVSGGEIRFNGRRIDGAGMRAVAALGIARTFQHVQLVADMSVLDNVALGHFRHASAGMASAVLGLDAAAERAARADAAWQIERVGLAEVTHTPAAQLSLGQQRLVEIARALSARPQLLLLDEPAAGLRHGEKQALAALLRRLRDEGVTILLVEHDMEFLMRLVDRLVVMNFGEKIAEGTPAQVRANPLVVQAYLGDAA